MELFKQTNIDFLRIKWPFILASALLLAAGLGSLIMRGGPRYGIDFKGGALIYVKFAEKPPIDRLRAVISQKLGGATPEIQEIAGSTEVIVGTDVREERELARARQLMVEALAENFGQGQAGKLDVNSASLEMLVERLRGLLAQAGVTLSDQQLRDMAGKILEFRDSAPRSGLVRSVDELARVEGVTPTIANVLKQQLSAAPYAIRNTEIVGPKIGNELRWQAMMATIYALIGMLIYIGLRFEWVNGIAAVIAVLHDTLITVGLLSIFDFELSLTVVAALLTLVGYSMNDKIVVFDRVRENLRTMTRESLPNLINISINQTLSRTILTGGLTFLCAVSLLIFGGPVLRGFALAFVVGIIVGTYSSIFIATPIVVLVQRKLDSKKQRRAGIMATGSPLSRKTPAKAVK